MAKMVYSDNVPCVTPGCDAWLKSRHHGPSWKPKPGAKYWYSVYYVCKRGHVHYNESDKVYPNRVRIDNSQGLFRAIEKPVQQTLIQSKPVLTEYESRRRKCWICRRRFLSESGNEKCPECIAKSGEQKVKAEPKPVLDKTPLTASEKAKVMTNRRPWLNRLRAQVKATTFAQDMKDPEFVGIYRGIIAKKMECADNPEVLNIALLAELNRIGGTRTKKARRR